MVVEDHEDIKSGYKITFTFDSECPYFSQTEVNIRLDTPPCLASRPIGRGPGVSPSTSHATRLLLGSPTIWAP